MFSDQAEPVREKVRMIREEGSQANDARCGAGVKKVPDSAAGPLGEDDPLQRRNAVRSRM